MGLLSFSMGLSHILMRFKMSMDKPRIYHHDGFWYVSAWIYPLGRYYNACGKTIQAAWDEYQYVKEYYVDYT
jgi:hypothetical protein